MGKLYRIAAASLACSLLAGCGDTTAVPEGQGAATQQDADDAHYIESLTPTNDYYGYIMGIRYLIISSIVGAIYGFIMCIPYVFVRGELELIG